MPACTHWVCFYDISITIRQPAQSQFCMACMCQLCPPQPGMLRGKTQPQEVAFRVFLLSSMNGKQHCRLYSLKAHAEISVLVLMVPKDSLVIFFSVAD